MTYFWAINVEDNLFLGYQLRRLVIFRISASKTTYFQVIRVEDDFWVISVEDDVDLGYQRSR